MNINKFVFRATFAALGIASLSACQAINMQESFAGVPIAAGAIAPAPMAAPRTGDKYYYSNGTYNKVTNVTASEIEWENNRKRKSITSFDPMAPQMYLETKTREYKKQSGVSVDDIWPLAVGKTSSFSTNISFRSKETMDQGEFKQYWRCNVDGAERVRVAAGTFNTYRITCERRSRSPRTGRTYYRQKVIYHYAPEIGTYVRYESHIKKKATYVRELIAVRPDISFLSDSTARNIRHTFQDALENYQNDKSVNWAKAGGNINTTTAPLQTFQTPEGKFCRNYHQTINQGDGNRLYVGVACREDRLKWLTPRR